MNEQDLHASLAHAPGSKGWRERLHIPNLRFVIAALSPLLPLACLYLLKLALIDNLCEPNHPQCSNDEMMKFAYRQYAVPLWLDILVAGVAIALGSGLQNNKSNTFIIRLWWVVVVINVALFAIPPKLHIESPELTVFLPAVISYLAAAATGIKAFEPGT
jgi:hypothetical protein